MTSIILLGNIQLEEIVTNLLKFYSDVEIHLSTRVHQDALTHPEKRKGTKEALDTWLRTLVVNKLKEILPGVGIEWDDQISIPPIYTSSSVALVDLVDGANEYLREGINVTSHIGIFSRQNGNIGPLQIGIVSYPFHRFRVITVGDQKGNPVYYLPFEFDFMANSVTDRLEKMKLTESLEEKKKTRLNIVDRYVNFDKRDSMRRRLDLLREKVYKDSGSYAICRGSVAKTIVDVALGVSDVAICKHRSLKIPLADYLTPSKILKNRGGVFVDLNGTEPNGKDPIEGFIATSSKKIYSMFREEVFL